MLRTRLTEQHELDVPFVGAGMSFVSMPSLVAAVSNAGGLGTLGAGLVPPDGLRALIHSIRAQTSRPFGVNFITQFTTDAHIDICLEERVPVVSFHWNDPPAAFMARLRTGGVKVWLQVGSVEMAREAVRLGVDAVIAQGSEAGGHVRGVASTLVLVPAVVDAISPTPVLAAGGIADGRGVAAALVLGADGVWVGTRLVATLEAHAHEEYKRRIAAASVADTMITTLFGPEWPNQPVRALQNRVVREWAGREREAPFAADSTQSIGLTQLGEQEYLMPKFSAMLPTPETSGDFEEMVLAAGESAGLVRDIKPAGEVVRKMMAEAEQIIRYKFVGVHSA